MAAIITGLSVSSCASDSSGWFGEKWRTFGSSSPPAAKPAPAKAAASPAPRRTANSVRPPAPRTNDPAVHRMQDRVNDEVERMRRAMEQSVQSSPNGVSAKATPVIEDSDSLAAKLAQPSDMPPGTSTPPSPDRRPAPAQVRPPVSSEPPSQERPVIRRIPKSSSSSSMKITRTKHAEGKPVEPAAVRPAKPSAGIEITGVEPVATVKPRIDPPKPTPEAPVATPAPANTAAKVDFIEPENPEAALDRMIRRLEQKAKDRPEDTETQLKLRLIYTIRGQWQQALKDKGGKSTTAGELARSVAALVKAFDSGGLSSTQQANEALKIVNQMKELLSRQADLVISNIQLCWKVDSFGSFKVMSKEYFVAGRKLPVIVYLELENFASQYLPDRKVYQTLLSMGIEVLDATGRRLWEDHYDKIEDAAGRQRRDFFLGTRITLPAGLPEGKLRLKVTIEDQHGNKSAQKMIGFEILPK